MTDLLPMAQPVSSTEAKTDVYVCSGCGIGECIDTEKLAAVGAEFGAPARVRPPMCLPEGVEALRRELAESGATRAVIAACSERVNADIFSTESLGMDLVGRVNIREFVAWSKPAGDEETQLLAEDYVRMGVVRAQRTQPATANVKTVETSVLVVGGGITGITAALEAATAGHAVHLIEKEPELGGWVGKWHKLFPTRPPYRDLEALAIDDLIDRVTRNPLIHVHRATTIASIAGEPGGLDVRLGSASKTEELTAGAVVMATGWQPDTEGPAMAHLGLGTHADVITNLAFESVARRGVLQRPSGKGLAKRIAFVLRPTADETKHFSYGTNVLDMVSLKQALYVREIDPDARAFLVYEDVVTPGQYESFYRRVQQEPNVYFTKGRVREVTAVEDGTLLLHLDESLLGPNVALQADLVVLAAGMVPSTADSAVLNLLYKQGPGLPTAKYGFSDSNFICFPYETRRTGLYAAGSVREPMDMVFSAEDATGAALKAIQSLDLIAKGKATHPRSGDLSLPETRLQGCTKCGRCSEECPFSAIEVDEQGFPTLEPDRCRRCGICMGACPTRVISFEDYSVEQLSAMIKAIKFPDDEAKPRIVALACENDAYPAFDLAGISRMQFDASVRLLPLRCLGSLNVAVVADALSAGIDGVMLVGCRSGDDYQCHFIKGSELAAKRLENIKETIGRLMIEPERVRPLELEISEYDQIPAIVSAFVEEVKAMGPNPYKGF